ncbi:Protein Hook-like protein, partial [Lachnellula suecica]
MPHSRTAGAALLKWVNSFPLDTSVESLELTDGWVLSKMLEDLDPAYTVDDFKKTTPSRKWLAKKSSLEAVYKSLLRYIRLQCVELDPIALEDPVDFNAIAEHDDAEQTLKVATHAAKLEFGLTDISFQLLTIFLLAAVHGPSKEKYVATITKLDLDSQTEIAAIIQKAKPKDPEDTETNVVDEELPPKITQDVQLALEEEHAKLLTNFNELKKRHADYITRFRRLGESHAELQEHSSEIESQLRTLQASDNNDTTDYIKELNSQIQEANELIANQEQQAETDRVTKDRQERELHTLRPLKQKLVDTEDMVNELKAENTTLARKANKVDHYQKKLENLQNIEKENVHLREQIETLELNMREFDKINHDKLRMETTIREVRILTANLETENVELIQSKIRLERQIKDRDIQIQKFLERQQHDERFIKDLQENNGDMPQNEDPPSPSNPKLTLEQELEQSGDPTPNYSLEISRLRAENQVLKSSAGGTSNADLRIELEESDRLRKRLVENFQELTEKYAISEQQLNAALSSSTGEKLVKNFDFVLQLNPSYRILTDDFYRDKAFSNLQKLHLETIAELSSTKSKLKETQTELAVRGRELLTVKADLEAVNREEINALEVLKETNEIVTSSLQNDLLVLQQDHKNVTTDFEQQKTHLLETLLAKEQLMKDLANAKEKGVAGGGDTQLDEQEKAELRKSAEIASSYVSNLGLTTQQLQLIPPQQLQKQDQVIQDLQRRLKIAEESTPDAQKAAQDSMIKNLTRENALIASAWYDLTGRLQSNHVVLQRRQDAPKSWLNKQRQMVNATP